MYLFFLYNKGEFSQKELSMNIAIIPARGGSKRIPRKNIKNFHDKPIISYSIEAALESGLFDEVMVSTDDNEIAEIAKKYGAKVPFKRSASNANDFATTSDVLSEVLSWYKENDSRNFEYLCCIYPTAPFAFARDLITSMDKLKQTQADGTLPIARFSYPPQRGLIIKDNYIQMERPQYESTHSQDLEPLYHDAGQYYIIRISAFLAERTLFCKNTVPVVLPDNKVQDIDSLEDWELAELKYERMQKI
jgi:N-acylneuraminate cytidylyltransferase